jgi:hypothetical protein
MQDYDIRNRVSASRLNQIKDLDFRFLGLPLDELFGIGFSMNRRRAATRFRRRFGQEGGNLFRRSIANTRGHSCMMNRRQGI